MEQNLPPGSSRRRFLGQALAASATMLVTNRVAAQAGAPGAADAGAPAAPAAPSHPSLSLPPLPYAQNALEPYISGTTLSFHYGKHHKAYFDKTNTLVEGTPFKGKPLEDIVKGSAKGKQHQKLFNNAAQAWNHNFY